MKTLFWNVVIEIYADGTVKAAVLWSRKALSQPVDSYKWEPKREVYSVWFTSEAEAQSAVTEALEMNAVQVVAA